MKTLHLHLCSWFCLLAFLLPQAALCQSGQMVPDNQVYAEHIRSVKFHLMGAPLSYPIIQLNSNARLVLRFDDLRGDAKDYVYSILHCDADWTPSSLSEMEYLNGFSEEYILNYDFSFNTRKDYTHYRLLLPNEDMSWRVSGNYLLRVYDISSGDKQLVITRRFMVLEQRFKTFPRFINVSQVSNAQTHQELDFRVTHKGFPINRPLQEVKAHVLQNGRWDNAITSIQPRYFRGFDLLFDYRNKFVFPAGKEFRWLDLRTMDSRNVRIASIDRFDDHFEVRLHPEVDWEFAPYLFEEDINGNFVIDNFDDSRILNNPAGGTEFEQSTQADPRLPNPVDLSSEYVEVFFTLKCSQPFPDHNVFIFGYFNDWSPRHGYELTYNPAINAYVGKVLLKQGYYNYYYGIVPKNGGPVDYSEFQGNWFETENDYSILVYYRDFTGRYDRLLGAITFNSND